MEILLWASLFYYLLMASCFLNKWLKLFKQDASMTSEDRLLSRWILVIATISWPIVVPVAYLELLKTQEIDEVEVSRNDSSSSLRPLLISIFLSSLISVSGVVAIAYMFAYRSS